MYSILCDYQLAKANHTTLFGWGLVAYSSLGFLLGKTAYYFAFRQAVCRDQHRKAEEGLQMWLLESRWNFAVHARFSALHP